MKIHVVRKGDTLYDIAQKYGVDLDVLIAANPQIDDPDVLMIGQKIRIPSKGVVDAPARQEEASVEAAAASGEDLPAMAASGDGGGERGGHGWNDNWNHDWNNNHWNGHGNGDDDEIRYTVRPGDTLWEIAHRFGLSLQELVAANPQIENPDLIRVGDVIRIPRKKAMPPYYPPYGPVAPYPPYPMPSQPGCWWGFQWSFVPPAGEGGADHSGQGQRGPWTPFTVWVPYEYSFPFYTDMMPGSYGPYPVSPFAMENCPKKMARGEGEQEEEARA